MDLDLDTSALASVWNEGWPGGTGIVLGFRVAEREQVDRLYEELFSGGYASQQTLYDAFWGSRFVVVADPDGNSVTLMSPPIPPGAHCHLHRLRTEPPVRPATVG